MARVATAFAMTEHEQRSGVVRIVLDRRARVGVRLVEKDANLERVLRMLDFVEVQLDFGYGGRHLPKREEATGALNFVLDIG